MHSASNQILVLRRQPIGSMSPESSAYQNQALALSATNQIQVIRHPSRHPIRIEPFNTRELSARVQEPSRLSAFLGSLKPILKHRIFHPLPPPHLISSHSYYYFFLHAYVNYKLLFQVASRLRPSSSLHASTANWSMKMTINHQRSLSTNARVQSPVGSNFFRCVLLFNQLLLLKTVSKHQNL